MSILIRSRLACRSFALIVPRSSYRAFSSSPFEQNGYTLKEQISIMQQVKAHRDIQEAKINKTVYVDPRAEREAYAAAAIAAINDPNNKGGAPSQALFRKMRAESQSKLTADRDNSDAEDRIARAMEYKRVSKPAQVKLAKTEASQKWVEDGIAALKLKNERMRRNN